MAKISRKNDRRETVAMDSKSIIGEKFPRNSDMHSLTYPDKQGG
jgi:hypothetical protein